MIVMESPKAMQRSNSNSKSKNKSSLLMCLKPVTMDEEDGGVLSPAVEDGGESRRKRKGRNRWQALSAALRRTTLKKVISRRKANKEKMSRSNGNLEDNKIISSPQFKSTHGTASNASSTSGRSSPALTPSSPLSSTSSISRAASSSSRADYLASISSPRETHSARSPLSLINRTQGVTKHKQIYIDYRREGRYYGTCTATCMLLISLLFLVTWGKCLAILCTSLWLYVVRPVRRRSCNYNEHGSQSGLIGEFDLVQYRRKIIMEGLLERSHSNVSLTSCSTRKSCREKII